MQYWLLGSGFEVELWPNIYHRKRLSAKVTGWMDRPKSTINTTLTEVTTPAGRWTSRIEGSTLDASKAHSKTHTQTRAHGIQAAPLLAALTDTRDHGGTTATIAEWFRAIIIYTWCFPESTMSGCLPTLWIFFWQTRPLCCDGCIFFSPTSKL